jgi:S-adenosylmethionine:tRNA ribosyltransferase-isomerase
MRVGSVTKINDAAVRVEEVCPEGERVISVESDDNLFEGGVVPLPPYIERASDPTDRERYQTIFARGAGSGCRADRRACISPQKCWRGLPHAFITLHVGTGDLPTC